METIFSHDDWVQVEERAERQRRIAERQQKELEAKVAGADPDKKQATRRTTRVGMRPPGRKYSVSKETTHGGGMIDSLLNQVRGDKSATSPLERIRQIQAT